MSLIPAWREVSARPGVVVAPDERLPWPQTAALGAQHVIAMFEIKQFCKENLANYKVPDIVEIMSAFPMTTTEKIQRFRIKEMMDEKYAKEGH